MALSRSIHDAFTDISAVNIRPTAAEMARNEVAGVHCADRAHSPGDSNRCPRLQLQRDALDQRLPALRSPTIRPLEKVSTIDHGYIDKPHTPTSEAPPREPCLSNGTVSAPSAQSQSRSDHPTGRFQDPEPAMPGDIRNRQVSHTGLRPNSTRSDGACTYPIRQWSQVVLPIELAKKEQGEHNASNTRTAWLMA